MKATNALIAWNPGGAVIVRDINGRRDDTERFVFTGGAAYIHWRRAKGDKLRAMLFTDFNTIVVRDRVDPQVAHAAFLAIDEYRLWISPDMDGALDTDGPEAGFG